MAHRLSTLRSADRIYVIEKGRAVQQGSYDDLVKEKGLFARLVSRQKIRAAEETPERLTLGG